jgi:uncharacterized protein
MRFAGYAAIFDRPDRGGDVIRKGAFAGARAGGTPLLWQHDSKSPIGWIESLSEDERGLRVIAEVDENAPAAALLGEGKVNGLSFGYRVRSAARTGTYRELNQLELIEVSLVTHPMQPLARVLAVERLPSPSGEGL